MKSDLLVPLALPVLLMLAQCSPVAPPLARGSAHFRTKVPSDPEPGTTCTDSYGGIGADMSVPDLPGSGNLTNLGTMVVDGEQSTQSNTPYAISCKITGNGDMRIEGRMEGPNSSPFLTDAGSGTWIEIDGTVAANGTGSGSVTFYTTTTRAVGPKPDTFCDFSATPSPRKLCSNQSCLSGETPMDYGSMVITFNCLNMDMVAAGIASDCEADGTIVLDRCSY